MQRMLRPGFIMNAWSFRSVGSVHFVEFLRCIWPSFEPPGQQLAVMWLPLDSRIIHIQEALTVLTFLLTVIQVYRGDFFCALFCLIPFGLRSGSSMLNGSVIPILHNSSHSLLLAGPMTAWSPYTPSTSSSHTEGQSCWRAGIFLT